MIDSSASGHRPAGDARPRVWPVFLAFFCILALLQIVSGVALGANAVFKHARPGAGLPTAQETANLIQSVARTPGLLAALTAASSLTFGISAILLGLWSPEGIARRLRLRRTGLSTLLFAAFGFFALSDALDHLMNAYHWERFSRTLPTIDAAMKHMTGSWFPIGLLVFGLLPGICEELFFRGFIQSRLTLRWGVMPGIVITALLFGLAHFDPVHSTATFVMGLALGWITERTGSLWPALAAHCSNNVLCFVAATLPLHSDLPVQWRFLAMLVLATSAFVLIDGERT